MLRRMVGYSMPLADVHAAQGNLEAAIADYDQALQITPAGWRYRKMVEDNLARIRNQLMGK